MHESPENFHFERGFGRACAARVGLELDILHDFEHDYAFIGRGLPAGTRRVKYTGLAGLKKLFKDPYDLVVLLDFPKRERCAPGFVWLAREAKAGKKVFVANHLIPMPGDNFTGALSRRVKALAGVDAGYMLEFDDKRLWGETGLGGKRLLRRGYATDCEYYKEQGTKPGEYVFSAGSTGRDFEALAAGVKKAGFKLKIFSDMAPKALPRGVDFKPLSKNLEKLRGAAAGARAVVVPVRDGHINEAAGNSIAFLAMALGKPVLTRRTRYMSRFIQDGVNGFLYPILSPDSIVAGLESIKALSPAKSLRMGAAARATILKKANLDSFTASLLNRFLKK